MKEHESNLPFVQIKNLTKIFNGYKALDNLYLDIYKGELFCILGGSGSGKTTLLRILAGLDSPDEGSIIVDGIDMKDIPPYKRPINLMFQSYALFPHMNVWDNVAFGLKRERCPKQEITKRVEYMLNMVKLLPYHQRKPHQLSGGQRQRVALARSLIKKPKLLLLDEPLGALDRKLREETQFELIKLQQEIGTTFIVVTHDQEEAMTLASRICIMDSGQISQVADPRTIYENPNCLDVAKFIGSINIFEGQVSEDESTHIRVISNEIENPIYAGYSSNANCSINQNVSIGVRPEKLELTETKPKTQYNWGAGKIVGVVYMGSLSFLRMKLKHSNKILNITVSNIDRHDDDWITGEEVYVTWEPSNLIILTI